jgi:hypothetical protein
MDNVKSPTKEGMAMGRIGNIQDVQYICTIRFVKGYRYLDKTGEALLRLEDLLDKGWVTGEVSPNGGNLVNYRLGMAMQFNSSLMNVQQAEYLSFDDFRDQACRAFQVLWETFQIEYILSPALAVVCQVPFKDLDEAQEHIRSLQLVRVDPQLREHVVGAPESTEFTFTTRNDTTWEGRAVSERYRVNAAAIHQVHRPGFDNRLQMRLSVVPKHQREALQYLKQMREKQPTKYPNAAQFHVELAFEGEFSARTFSLERFLKRSFDWSRPLRILFNGKG